jgi:hypothetical protein
MKLEQNQRGCKLTLLLIIYSLSNDVCLFEKSALLVQFRNHLTLVYCYMAEDGGII